jgi:gamma-glutamyltranspeptidase / glutathione hydrolase
MRTAVAAGHPATTDAGVEILAEGGTAADAAVAACLASCVAETVMTGLLGGGHGIYFEGATGDVRNLDCFVAVPGLGGERRDGALVELAIPFGEELVHYAVGIASCAVPGLPAGLDELWRRHGRLPWKRLVEPALRLARSGVELPPEHASCLAMLAPVMTMNEGARIYSPGGSLLEGGNVLEQPGLAAALESIGEEGARSVYSGSLAAALLALVEERGGLVTREDLAAYRPAWGRPVAIPYAGTTFATRCGLSRVPESVARLPRLGGLDESRRVLALIDTLAGDGLHGDTTNVAVVDAHGSACVLTTSLGLGSGDFLPGFDLHLNSMLGEVELLRSPLAPGGRMESMMAPSVAIDRDGLALAAGAAGGSRLRGALLQVVAGVLDEGIAPERAVERPRLHPIGSLVHLEAGFTPETVAAVESAGYEPRVWPGRHHYFGGVSIVTRLGAAGDPRRAGAAVVA